MNKKGNKMEKEINQLISNYEQCKILGVEQFYGSYLVILCKILRYKEIIIKVQEKIEQGSAENILKNTLEGNNVDIAFDSEIEEIILKIRQTNNNRSLSILHEINKEINKMIQETKNPSKETILNKLYEEFHRDCPDMKKDEFLERIERYGTDGIFCTWKLMDEQIAVNQIPDITKEEFFEKYPEFAEKVDKDGLIDLSVENYELMKKTNPDGMYYKDHFIYYDNFFRTARGFLDVFFDYFAETKDIGNIFKLKLNYDKIVSLKKYKYVVLCGAGFYGPNFKEDDIFAKIQNKTILTKKQRINPKFSDFLGNNIKETEFFLDQENSSFQVEEISQDIKDNYITNRFIHSEFNIINRLIKHLDGALLYYNPQDYSKREKTTLTKKDKINEKKEKIFRIDGKIDVKKWMEIILQFFIHNEMILEYFDFDAYKEEYKEILNYEAGIDF